MTPAGEADAATPAAKRKLSFTFRPLARDDLPTMHAWLRRPHVAEWTDPGARGIEPFLAHRDQLGQGLGRAMVDAFAAHLFDDPAVTRIQTDPAPNNARAIRSYRGAGFVIEGEVATPDGPALLMIRHRNSS